MKKVGSREDNRSSPKSDPWDELERRALAYEHFYNSSLRRALSHTELFILLYCIIRMNTLAAIVKQRVYNKEMRKSSKSSRTWASTGGDHPMKMMQAANPRP